MISIFSSIKIKNQNHKNENKIMYKSKMSKYKPGPFSHRVDFKERPSIKINLKKQKFITCAFWRALKDPIHRLWQCFKILFSCLQFLDLLKLCQRVFSWNPNPPTHPSLAPENLTQNPLLGAPPYLFLLFTCCFKIPQEYSGKRKPKIPFLLLQHMRE